jgi:hypothetical protein
MPEKQALPANGTLYQLTGGEPMADGYINVVLDDERIKQLTELGLGEKVSEVGGQKVVRVEMTKKDQKKLEKGYPGLAFDADNACVLPEKGDQILWKIITDMKSVDVMKFAITKLYNPLAGRDVFGRGAGSR